MSFFEKVTSWIGRQITGDKKVSSNESPAITGTTKLHLRNNTFADDHVVTSTSTTPTPTPTPTPPPLHSDLTELDIIYFVICIVFIIIFIVIIIRLFIKYRLRIRNGRVSSKIFNVRENSKSGQMENEESSYIPVKSRTKVEVDDVELTYDLYDRPFYRCC